MDQVLQGVYRQMHTQRHCSVDRILTGPILRTEFIAECRAQLGPDADEEALLSRLISLRKQSKLSRSTEITAVTRVK